MPLGLTVGLLVGEEGGDGVLVCEAVILGEDVLLGVEAGEPVSEEVILGEDVLLAVYVEEPVAEGVVLHVCDAETDSEEVGVND
jgi:hypothetical protein